MNSARRSALSYIGDMSGQMAAIASRCHFPLLAGILNIAAHRAQWLLAHDSDGQSGDDTGEHQEDRDGDRTVH